MRIERTFHFGGGDDPVLDADHCVEPYPMMSSVAGHSGAGGVEVAGCACLGRWRSSLAEGVGRRV